jgi:glyceraldehyde 3-phosphate dehydrogenase
MSVRVGINGFGRIGRLALRAGWGWPEITFAHINELKGDAATSAHLLTFDSVHGRWPHDVHGEGDTLVIDEVGISYSSYAGRGSLARL